MRKYKNILYINLNNRSFDFKIQEDLWELIGGTPTSYKLLYDNIEDNPVIISTGPLSGYFPYVSKANLLYISKNKTIVEKYGGGSIASSLNMAQIDALVLIGDSTKNLHIAIYDNDVTFLEESDEAISKRVSDLVLTADNAVSQGYFSFGDFTNSPLSFSSKISINIEYSISLDLKDFFDYEKAYQTALSEYKSLKVEPGNNPSCVGCPIGCELSKEGEEDQNIAILPRCLISCAYAEDIYKNIPFVYLCLTSIGYNYRHEDLESISERFGELKKSLNNIIST